MAMARPYQPSLLRVLHGLTACVVLLAWISGSLLLLGADHPQGAMSLPQMADLGEQHEAIGLVLVPPSLLFALYAITAGRTQLRQAANLLPLLMLVLALGSGLLMDRDGLFSGDLHHLVKNVHVFAWAGLALSVLWHLLAMLRRGGLPLIRSMLSVRVQTHDRPIHWPGQLLRSLQRQRR